MDAKVIIEADAADLKKYVEEYQQKHVDDCDSDECINYVRRKIINTVSIDEADIRFFYDGEKYVTW